MRRALEFGFVDASGMLGPGVYALCQGEEVVYVGQARILVTRIYTHRNLYARKRKGLKPVPLNGGNGKPIKVVPFNGVMVFPCEVGQLNALEAELIVRWNPKHNVIHRPVQKLRPLSDLGITLESLGVRPRAPIQVERRD